MHMIQFNDIWEKKLFPLLIVRGWKYRRGGENIVTIFSPRGEDIVGVKISSHSLHGQYLGGEWPGNTKFKGIDSHGIDLVFLEFFYLTTREVKSLRG